MFIKYQLADGTYADVEVTEEVAEYLAQSKREIANSDRRYRRRVEYHVERPDFDDGSFAYHLTPEQVLLRKEQYESAWNTLTEKQRRRAKLWLSGYTFRDIAAMEDADYSSIGESVETGLEKFRKNF
ncbi:MAG: hypothetical protein J5916_08450 [Oscillospiraceae bacterium]|nr:hypothetical protein [Oscillospiraceae bacterium]